MSIFRDGPGEPTTIGAMDWQEMEGIAQEFVDSAGLNALPVDIHLLAHCHGVHVIRGAVREAATTGNLVVYVERETAERTLFDIAHELAHVAIGKPCTRDPGVERAANYIGGALLAPGREAQAFLRRTGHDLQALVDSSGMSWEACGRRYVQLNSALLRVWDGSRLSVNVASPWMTVRPIAPHELEATKEARATRAHVRPGGRSGTYYVGGQEVERVVAVWAIDEWEDVVSAR